MINLNNISKRYGELVLFENFNATFEEHLVHCILGGSGVGKTTLIHMIAGLVTPDSGSVDLPENSRPSYVFQEPRLLPWFDVFGNLDFVLHEVYPDKQERQDIILHYLEKVGLEDFAHASLQSLSGGMVQRVALCRAFAYPSTLLLLDEPFIGLDSKLKEELLEFFARIYEEDERTVFFVTHDIPEALRLADTISVLKNRPVQVAGRFIKSEFAADLPLRIRDML